MKPLPGKAYRGALEYTSRCALGEYLGFTPGGLVALDASLWGAS